MHFPFFSSLPYQPVLAGARALSQCDSQEPRRGGTARGSHPASAKSSARAQAKHSSFSHGWSPLLKGVPQAARGYIPTSRGSRRPLCAHTKCIIRASKATADRAQKQTHRPRKIRCMGQEKCLRYKIPQRNETRCYATAGLCTAGNLSDFILVFVFFLPCVFDKQLSAFSPKGDGSFAGLNSVFLCSPLGSCSSLSSVQCSCPGAARLPCLLPEDFGH